MKHGVLKEKGSLCQDSTTFMKAGNSQTNNKQGSTLSTLMYFVALYLSYPEGITESKVPHDVTRRERHKHLRT